MHEYIKNENKSHDIFRANVIAYMLNCHAEGKIIRQFDMRQFCTATSRNCTTITKNEGMRIQLHNMIAKILDRGLIKRVSKGVYAVVSERAMDDELYNAKVNAGLEKIEVNNDQILDYLNRDNPNPNNFRINVLRHLINLYIQQMPIRLTDFNQFSAYHQPRGSYSGVRYIFNTLLNAGAIERGIKPGTCHVTDLNIVKKMLCDKENSVGVPPSYPGMAKRPKAKQQPPAVKMHAEEKWQFTDNKPSPWHKPAPAWIGALDAVMGNLGR